MLRSGSTGRWWWWPSKTVPFVDCVMVSLGGLSGNAKGSSGNTSSRALKEVSAPWHRGADVDRVAVPLWASGLRPLPPMLRMLARVALFHKAIVVVCSAMAFKRETARQGAPPEGG